MHRIESPSYGYSVVPTADHFELSYTRGKHGFVLVFVAFVGTIVLLYGGFVYAANYHGMFKGEAGPGVFLLIFLAACLASAIALIGGLALRLKKAVIRVFADRIETDGRAFDRQHIKALYVTAPNNAVAAGSTFAVGGGYGVSGVVAAGMATVHNAAGEVRQFMGELSDLDRRMSGWTIWIDYGTRPVAIGKHLNEQKAGGVYAELVTLITSGFDQSGHVVARSTPYPVEAEPVLGPTAALMFAPALAWFVAASFVYHVFGFSVVNAIMTPLRDALSWLNVGNKIGLPEFVLLLAFVGIIIALSRVPRIQAKSVANKLTIGVGLLAAYVLFF